MKEKEIIRLSRRDFFKYGSAGLAVAALARERLVAAAGKKIPIGLQLYSVRAECAKDLPGTVAAVGKMGYKAVEFAGYYDRTAKDLRKLLDDNGLKCCGTHTQMDTLLPAKLVETIEFNKELGNPNLIVPSLGALKTKQAWLDTARLFNELSQKVAKHGMRVGYHNHDFEFKPIDGELPWDLFFGNTDKSVIMQFDVGNGLMGGGDPIGFIKKYPGRARTVHVKEYSKANPKALIGEGDVNWKQVFDELESQGATDWYIVEYESDAYPPVKAVELCLQNLHKMGK